jgi:hypothetical protein
VIENGNKILVGIAHNANASVGARQEVEWSQFTSKDNVRTKTGTSNMGTAQTRRAPAIAPEKALRCKAEFRTTTPKPANPMPIDDESKTANATATYAFIRR